MREISRAELECLPASLLLAMVRLDTWPSDYARTLSQATLERILDIAQGSDQMCGVQAECPTCTPCQPRELLPADG